MDLISYILSAIMEMHSVTYMTGTHVKYVLSKLLDE
jgi:hypothetical protein